MKKEIKDEINLEVQKGIEKVKKRLPNLFDTTLEIERIEWEIQVLLNRLNRLKQSEKSACRILH